MTAADRPIGYFVHHQGRGHAERCAAVLNALPRTRPATIFCARDDIFPDLRAGTKIRTIPSLFEPTGAEREAHWVATPDTLHCAPVGWPGIREGMATMAAWFAQADPALMICDVSAEVAQLARLCSVPHVKVLQHGDRTDPGHRAAYDGAAGLLVPCHEALAQADWTPEMRAKACFAGGIGADMALPDRAAARARIGVPDGAQMVLVMSGAGGGGLPSAPLGVGARALPDALWITIGPVARDWHATEPANLRHDGWVANAIDYIAAADLIVASTGNTTCQQILAAGRPWIAVPEWRYFDEQVAKARALAQAGTAVHLPSLPASAQAWRDAVARAHATHDPARQRAMVRPDAAAHVARWLTDLVHRLEGHPAPQSDSADTPAQEPAMTPLPDAPLPRADVSVLIPARGRADHLANVVLGLTQQTRRPAELIVAVMQDADYADLPAAPFPIRQIRVPGDALPLSAARNAAAAVARGSVLVFLDVDCIPAPTLVADYAAAATAAAGLLMGEVLYLPAGADAPGWHYDAFRAVGVRHSDRQAPPDEGMRVCEDYRCFWSLNFAMHRDDWAAGGGFDERFTGYGGEDTDFGRTLTERGIAINWIRGARVYHQFHDHCMPPIHAVASVIRNAELFASKWGHRTMEHWLHGFRMMGLIDFTRTGIRILRTPDADDFDLCRQEPHMPYAATGRVIRILEDRARAQSGLPTEDLTTAERHARMTAEQDRLTVVEPGMAAE